MNSFILGAVKNILCKTGLCVAESTTVRYQDFTAIIISLKVEKGPEGPVFNSPLQPLRIFRIAHGIDQSFSTYLHRTEGHSLLMLP
jgi:hypothetical protein